jgi:hypothetical protein
MGKDGYYGEIGVRRREKGVRRREKGVQGREKGVEKCQIGSNFVKIEKPGWLRIQEITDLSLF